MRRGGEVFIHLVDLVAVHIVDLKEYLRVGNLHVVQTAKHLFDAIESLSVGDGRCLDLHSFLDVFERIKVLLYDERCSQLSAILILEMGSALIFVGVVRIIVDE